MFPLETIVACLFLIIICATFSNGQCDFHREVSQDRVDCGYPGISEAECLSRRCCWDDSIPDTGVNWCFCPNFRWRESEDDGVCNKDCSVRHTRQEGASFWETWDNKLAFSGTSRSKCGLRTRMMVVSVLSVFSGGGGGRLHSKVWTDAHMNATDF